MESKSSSAGSQPPVRRASPPPETKASGPTDTVADATPQDAMCIPPTGTQDTSHVALQTLSTVTVSSFDPQVLYETEDDYKGAPRGDIDARLAAGVAAGTVVLDDPAPTFTRARANPPSLPERLPPGVLGAVMNFLEFLQHRDLGLVSRALNAASRPERGLVTFHMFSAAYTAHRKGDFQKLSLALRDIEAHRARRERLGTRVSTAAAAHARVEGFAVEYGTALAALGLVREAEAVLRPAAVQGDLDARIALVAVRLQANDLRGALAALKMVGTHPRDQIIRARTLLVLNRQRPVAPTDFPPLTVPGSYCTCAMVEFTLGDTDASRLTLESAIEFRSKYGQMSNIGAAHIAEACAWCGDVEEAFKWLAEAVLDDDPDLPDIVHSPFLGNLKSSPELLARWNSFLESINASPRDLARIARENGLLPASQAPG